MRVLAAVLVLFAVSLARAQDTLTPYFGPGSWIIGSDETRAMRDILKLTPDQYQLCRDLARGARSEMGVLERKYQRAGMLHDQTMWVETPEGEAARKAFDALQTRHAAECERIEKQFLSDAKGLLDAAQSPHWETFERARRRIILQWFEEVDATNADLARLVRGMTLTSEEREGVTLALEKYEHDVDALILEYRAIIKERPHWSSSRWYRNVQEDPEEIDANKKKHDIAVRMGRTQRTYAQMLAGRLPGERGEEILRAIEPMRGWYGPMSQDHRLREIMRVRGVTDEQRAAMRAVFSKAEREFRRNAGEYFDLTAKQAKGEDVDEELMQKAQTKTQESYAKARAAALKGALDALTPEQRRGYEDGTDEAKGEDEEFRGEGWWW